MGRPHSAWRCGDGRRQGAVSRQPRQLKWREVVGGAEADKARERGEAVAYTSRQARQMRLISMEQGSEREAPD